MRHEAERCMPKLPVLRLLFALFLVTTPLPLASATDQPAADASPPPLETLTHEQAHALIARLSDAQVRELLLQHLDRHAPEPGSAAPGADAVSLVVDRAQRSAIGWAKWSSGSPMCRTPRCSSSINSPPIATLGASSR
jgi:hypothetical protein